MRLSSYSISQALVPRLAVLGVMVGVLTTAQAACGGSGTDDSDAGDNGTEVARAYERGQLLEHIEALSVDIGPRLATTDAERQAADYLASELSALGYSVDRQVVPTTFRTPGGDITPAESLNVIGYSADDRCAALAGAHYDSVGVSPAANDNASGAAVALEVAERLSRSDDAPSVCFAFFGAEESGLDGSQWFVRQISAPTEDRWRCLSTMINLDNVGGPGSITLTGSAELIADVSKTAVDLGIAVTSSAAPAPGITRSDHVPFVERGGIAALWITTPPYPLLHTEQDTIDHIDAGILASVSALAAAYLEEAGPGACT